MMFQLPSLERN